jgi:hypothetical protein
MAFLKSLKGYTTIWRVQPEGELGSFQEMVYLEPVIGDADMKVE